MHNNSKPALTRNFTQIDFKEFDLPNGLHLIVHRDTSTPIVSVDIWYHVGSKDEDKEKTGFAHLFEHMMFQGSSHVKKTEHFNFIHQAGGTLNGSTSHDRTNYFETLPSNQLKLALWLESDRMGYLNVNSENFNNQRDVVKEEKRQRQDNVPYGTKWLNLFSKSFKGEPYGWVPIGSMDDLDNATLEDAVSFYKRYYSPSNAVVVISGDINFDEAFEYTNRYFGNISRNVTDKKVFPKIGFNVGEVKETIYDSIQIPAIFIGYKIPGLKSDDAPALELFTSILGESKSSRLYSNIVYRNNLAKSAGAFAWDNELGGLLVISAMGFVNSDLDEIEKSITEETNKLITGTIAGGEIDKAKNNLEAGIIESLQTNIGKADTLAYYWTYFRNTNLVNTVFDKYSGITEDDIKKAASKYILDNNRVVLHYKKRNAV